MYRMLLIPYPCQGLYFRVDTYWYHNLRQHALKSIRQPSELDDQRKHSASNCLICEYRIPITPVLYAFFSLVLQEVPAKRATATEAAEHLERYMNRSVTNLIMQ